MSKKLYGPNGKPVDRAALRRQMEAAKAPKTKVENATVGWSHNWMERFIGPSIYGSPSLWATAPASPAEKPAGLREAVEAQIADLTGALPFESRAELPRPERDLTTYRDAYASAAAKCDHENAIEILWGREWTCDECGRSIGRAEMRRKRRGFWF